MAKPAFTTDGIAAARAGAKGAGAQGKTGPLVLADGTDNPGGGGYNDTTPLLQALLDAKIANVAFGTICDPATVQQAMKAGVGAEIDVELGGKTDESMGKPIKAKAIVKMLSDGTFKNDGPMNAGVETQMGPTAVLRIDGIDVVTISSRIQTIDLQVFLSQGIDPRARDVVVVKSVQHFRAAYAPIAREIVLVDEREIEKAILLFLNVEKTVVEGAGAQIDTGDAEKVARGLMEDEKTKIAWNVPRLLLPKNRVKLLLNMLLMAGQSIPRGGQITVDPVGEGETMGFKVTTTGTNAKVPAAMPGLLQGTPAEGHAVDAHAIQPFYTGMLAKACGLTASMALEGETVVVAARPAA